MAAKNAFSGARRLASGRWGAFDLGRLVATERTEDKATEALDDYADSQAQRSCTICDGLGHGYPGAGPCPLEEGPWEPEDPRERAFEALAEAFFHGDEDAALAASERSFETYIGRS